LRPYFFLFRRKRLNHKEHEGHEGFLSEERKEKKSPQRHRGRGEEILYEEREENSTRFFLSFFLSSFSISLSDLGVLRG
jgi:hypothetical protein